MAIPDDAVRGKIKRGITNQTYALARSGESGEPVCGDCERTGTTDRPLVTQYTPDRKWVNHRCTKCWRVVLEEIERRALEDYGQ